ncbi:Hsp70 family protein, partial [Anaerolinea sp.]
RNQADNAIYQVEKLLKERGDAVPASTREDIQAKINDLRQAMSGEDAEQIRNRMQTLTQAAVALQSVPQGQPVGGAGGDGAGEVVEGEFREA